MEKAWTTLLNSASIWYQRNKMSAITQKIDIHPLTQDPTKAWTEMQCDQDLQVMDVDVK